MAGRKPQKAITVPMRIWVSPTLANVCEKRERNDVLYVHEVATLGRPEIHDHFGGSAHCVECKGKCLLTGANRLATDLIRFIFEQWAAGYATPNMLLTDTLKNSGIDFDRFKKRAKDTNTTEQPNGN